MKVIAKNIPEDFYSRIQIFNSKNYLIEGEVYTTTGIINNRNTYNIPIWFIKEKHLWYPVEYFYTEKELHSLKFNNKIEELIK